jgi:hypothetical protein
LYRPAGQVFPGKCARQYRHSFNPSTSLCGKKRVKASCRAIAILLVPSALGIEYALLHQKPMAQTENDRWEAACHFIENAQHEYL